MCEDETYNFDSFELNNIQSKEVNFSFIGKKVEIKEFALNTDGSVFFNFGTFGNDLFIEKFMIVGKRNIKNLFENIRLKELVFENFQCFDSFTFQNIDVDKNSSLYFNNSNLDLVTFKPSILHKFNNIYISRSDFVGMSLIDFKYIEEKRISSEIIDINKQIIKTSNINFFRFLKNHTQNQSNLHLYQKYKAFEFNEILRQNEDIDGGEKFILEFNKFTNNHTTDWFKAFKLILITFSFYLYLITSYLLYSQNDFQFMDVSKILPNLLSPVSFLVNNDEFCFPNLIYFIDVFYNILIGLLLYQMIAAFRKFNR